MWPPLDCYQEGCHLAEGLPPKGVRASGHGGASSRAGDVPARSRYGPEEQVEGLSAGRVLCSYICFYMLSRSGSRGRLRLSVDAAARQGIRF